MKNPTHTTVVALAFALAAVSAYAQVHPVLERGFSPDSTYQVGDLDSVNTFNGNLVVSIPIGPSYPVGGRLSYQLTLTYNSQLWDFSMQPDDDRPVCRRFPDSSDCVGLEGKPTLTANAGLGWRLSLGDLLPPHALGNAGLNWLYVAPDGSRHTFVDTLHEGDPVHDAVWYTRDNSYMRLSVLKVDGAGNPVWMKVEGANGIERIFTRNGRAWRLWKIRDTFGNHLDISYGVDVWTLTDSVGRVHQIHWTTVTGRSVVSRVSLAAFGAGSRAAYDFSYHAPPAGIEESCQDTITGRDPVPVALLTGVSLPDGTAYRMRDAGGAPAYHTANQRDIQGCLPTSGILRRVVVPTGGVYEWTFGRVRFPTGGDCPQYGQNLPRSAFKTTAGVVRRTVRSAPGASSTWAYAYQPVSEAAKDFVTRTTTSPDGHDTVYYFDTRACRYDRGERDGWTGWAYGLPFTATSSRHGRFRSVLSYEGSGQGRVLKRARYVLYERDELPETPGPRSSWHDSNRRLAGEATYHVDDGWRGTGLTLSDFDGLGHYRQASRVGYGISGSRTEVTGFNPDRGTYFIDDDNNRVGLFDMLSPDDPWVLGTYDSVTQAEGTATAKQELCFDPVTGVLERTRTLVSGTSRRSTDLLTRFSYDAGGNLTREEFHGGDRNRIGTGSLCTLALGAPEYAVTHEYEYGSRHRTTYDGTNVRTLDADIDPNTGLVFRSRDVSGLGTSWTYDTMGRVTNVSPDQGARIRIEHHPAVGDAASALTPASVEIVYRSSWGTTTLAAETTTFDGVGRVTTEKRLLPDGSWAEKETEYSVSGLTDRVSEWVAEGAAASGTTFEDYDAFGRVGRVVAPDGSVSSFTYLGARSATRTVSVGTTRAGGSVLEEPFTTETDHDYLGRVSEVREPLGASQDVRSQYAYDVGGRLTRVTVVAPEGTQVRDSVYDNRGFLLSERMPEKGAAGNGVVTWSDFDARGHAWRLDDGPNHLSFEYDGAERLSLISEALGSKRLLEERQYGTANSGTDRAKGKLTRAVRHNYFDGVRDYRVEERHQYRGTGGRLSDRTTVVGVVGENREATFLQRFSWNDLGALASHTYPQLGYYGPARTVFYRYTNSFLTGIDGFAPSITYHPNGMTWRVEHENGVIDEQTLDGSGMARPGRIQTRFAHKEWTSGTFRYDGAGNIVGLGGDWFLYDGLGRVTEGTAVRANGTRGRQTYGYDGFGNLHQIWTAGTGSRNTTISPVTNRLATASYDAAGNQTSWGAGPLVYQYTYSPFNQVHLVTGGSPPVTRFYGYTADGERIASYASDTDVITHALRDLEGRVVREYEQVSYTGAWSWKQDLVWGGNGLLATIDAQGVERHHHVDHLGSPRLVTNSGGFEEARHNYYPFGEEATDPFADPNRIKFTGHERDLNLDGQTTDDLDYMHARFFNPNLGRFLSVDPVAGQVGRSQSWNRYAYAWNNPVNLTDPWGLAPGCAASSDDETSCNDTITVTGEHPDNERNRAAAESGERMLKAILAFLTDNTFTMSLGGDAGNLVSASGDIGAYVNLGSLDYGVWTNGGVGVGDAIPGAAASVGWVKGSPENLKGASWRADLGVGPVALNAFSGETMTLDKIRLSGFSMGVGFGGGFSVARATGTYHSNAEPAKAWLAQQYSHARSKLQKLSWRARGAR